MQYKHYVVDVQNKSKLQQIFQKSKPFFPFSFWFQLFKIVEIKRFHQRMAKIFTQLQNKQKRVKEQYNHHVVEVQNKLIFQPLFQKSKFFSLNFWVKPFKFVEIKRFH